MGNYSVPKLGILIFLLMAEVTVADYVNYKYPKVKVGMRVRDLLNRMSLDEKIGQMVQIERKVASSDVMKNSFIGTFLNLLLFFGLICVFFWG